MATLSGVQSVMVSLTDMAKASGKLFGNWNELNPTKQYLYGFESVMGNLHNGAITETLIGGVPSKQGTWAIEKVAIEFAGLCSVQFKLEGFFLTYHISFSYA